MILVEKKFLQAEAYKPKYNQKGVPGTQV